MSEPKTVTAPPTFADSTGRVWSLKLTLAAIERVQLATQLDLLPEDNDPTELTQLLFQDRKLGKVLWTLVETQATQEQVTHKQFLELCDENLLSAGWGALVDAIVFFIQTKNQAVGDALRETIEAQMRLLSAGADQIRETMQSGQTAAAVERVAANLGREIEGRIAQASASSVTN